MGISEVLDFLQKEYNLDRSELEASIKKDQEERAKGPDSYNAWLQKRDEEIQVKLERFREEYLSKHPSTIQIKSRGSQLHDERVKYFELQGSRIYELIQEYQNAVQEVKSNKKLTRKEKLEQLLTPLISLQEIFYPGYAGDSPKYKHHSYKFIDDSYIDLKNELDLDKLSVAEQIKPDEASLATGLTRIYTLYPNHDGKLITNETNISLSTEYLDLLSDRYESYCISEGISEWSITLGMISVAKLYEYWLPTLTQEQMRGKDVLDQILICYTIKRALNGDRKALEKLCWLYRGKAEATAINRAFIYGLPGHLYPDIRQEANLVLNFMIGGLHPEILMSDLKDDGKHSFFPIKSIEKFYIFFYSEYVPRNFDSFFREFSQNHPYALIKSSTAWHLTKKRIDKFNRYTYIPGRGNKMGPHTNLTTWLFGRRRGGFRDLFIELVLERYTKFSAKEIPHDFLDEGPEDEEDDWEERDFRKIAQRGGRSLDPKTVYKDSIEQMIADGVPKRNAEIFIKCITKIMTQAEIGEEYKLSRMQVSRIYKNLCKKYPPN